MLRTTKQMALLGLVTVASAIGVSGCGGVTDARTAARDRATKAACDRANECGAIGLDPSQSYDDYPSCVSAVNGFIDQTVWPVAQCGQINQQMLSVCISAIMGTQCANGWNLAITLGTCSAQMVCIGAADAGDRS